MQERIKDLRATIATLEQAKTTFNELAALELEIAKADAAFEHKVAKLKAAHAEALAGKIELHDSLAECLVAFIAANKGLFANPRKVKTDLGTFGLQTVTDLLVSDEKALIEAIDRLGYTECIKESRSPVKKLLADRIIAGEKFPGCQIRTGDTAVYSVKKALVDQAREEAE